MRNPMAHLTDHFDPEREFMVDPDDVGVILKLHKQGCGVKRIAEELGVSKNTVKRYVRQGEWVAYAKPKRKRRQAVPLKTLNPLPVFPLLEGCARSQRQKALARSFDPI